MTFKTSKDIPSSEITDEKIWLGRREAVRSMGVLLLTGLATKTAFGSKYVHAETSGDLILSSRDVTKEKNVTHYNNFYEFSYYKEEPASLAQALIIDPWSVEVSGLVEHPTTFALDDLQRLFPLQDRIYRLRCVEAWSAVIPWLGFPLKDLLSRVSPLSSAKYVKFTSVMQPEAMVNQRDNRVLAWPYVEALRIDEAVHPLTLLSLGMYGKPLMKQNGAPIRLVVPWKYGFKSIKSLVKIELVAEPPVTTWNQAAPEDYGFYANVNPEVPHPRWSQASERPLGSRFFTPRRVTQLFNGYQEEVGSLYSGMDLRRFY